MELGIQLGLNPPQRMIIEPFNVSDLYTWHDPSEDIYVTLNGSNVTAVFDRSGNGLNLSQPLAPNQPSYVDQLNGWNVITFDGVDDYLRSQLFSLSQPATIFFAVKQDSDPHSGVHRFYDSSVANRWSSWYDGRTGQDAYRASAGLILQQLENPADLNFNLYIVKVNGVSSSFERVGANPFLVSGDMGSTATMADLYLGASSTPANYLDGKFAEVLTYSKITNDTETAGLKNYYADKWGIV